MLEVNGENDFKTKHLFQFFCNLFLQFRTILFHFFSVTQKKPTKIYIHEICFNKQGLSSDFKKF